METRGRPKGQPRTGGRPRGTPNKKTAEKIAAIEASGLTPLDYMLSVLRDDSNPLPIRLNAANSAAPYVHPRLANIDVGTKNGQPLIVRIVKFGETDPKQLEKDG